MQGFDDTPVRTFGPLVRSECIHLLETHSLGRLAWQAADSQQVRPINYVFRSGALYFRTSPEGILSELVRPTDVALEVDDLDHDKRTGWSVIVNGRARAVAAPAEVIQQWETDDLAQWAPGIRDLFIQIMPSRISGRLLQRAQYDG
jgi:nitroimidazol reductase NimA-like FMN-containing flavoprotein (pyridoxamine 5'-phosphate oxidase superfamily)